MYTRKNRPMTAKESWKKILIRLSEQSLELVNIFKEASTVETHICFSLTRHGRPKLLKTFAHVRKVLI